MGNICTIYTNGESIESMGESDMKLSRCESLQRRLSIEDTPTLTRKSSRVLGLPMHTPAKALNTL